MKSKFYDDALLSIVVKTLTIDHTLYENLNV